MGIDANALLTSNPTPVAVMQYLDSLIHVDKVNITPLDLGFVRINFDWHGESRNMSCFYDGDCKGDYESVYPHNACFLSLGKWGMSDAIIMSLVKEFGGFYRLNDCADDWCKFGE